MLDYEEQTLFGAPPGQITELRLEVSHHDAMTRIRLEGRPDNRRNAYRIEVITERESAAISPIVGHMMPIMLRSRHLRGTLFKRALWAMHDWCGQEGYDVALKGCGRPTKR